MRAAILIDVSLPDFLEAQLRPFGELVPWSHRDEREMRRRINALYTYAHPRIDAPFLDPYPKLRIVSNFGVGVATRS